MIIAYGQKNRISYLDYIKRRFARIYPVYLIAIIILLAYYFVKKIPVDYKGLFYNLTMVQAWIPGNALSFNTPGWSISVELFFYVSFPFLFNAFYSKQAINKLFIPILLIFIASQSIFHWSINSTFYQGFPSKSHDLLFYLPLMHFNEFLIGNISGLIFLRKRKLKNYDWSIVGLLIFLILLLKFENGINYHNGMFAFIFVPIIILISSNTGIITKVFSNKHLVFLGEISYGIYIFQKPVYEWVNGILKYINLDNSTFVFYASLISLIIISAISYKYIETPLRRKINNIHIT
jgi:peptidoglycan/LPS O-acetylase OafA/YrhL